MLLFKLFIKKINLQIKAALILLLCFHFHTRDCVIVEGALVEWKLPQLSSFLCLADKTLVGAVMSAQALLLLHHRLTAGAAGPHHIQHLQAAQEHGHL